ncbi:MAG: SusC/RagA family TonB-linked outer membrane protein [Candidatus Pseudobacter hemicellulosilyticus]|uniref:SusC/RagA family TonB-linked outer membrane protein n=1 Tax=Candidatus Pseudobacter hemicellulosilyticus TaxID=3121375 RepID=A0AAJ5WR64_9BACT|nr:MAG: SusC/RagA family TonB-linked outer membrane protein [Pseudobacter sp.]
MVFNPLCGGLPALSQWQRFVKKRPQSWSSGSKLFVSPGWFRIVSVICGLLLFFVNVSQGNEVDANIQSNSPDKRITLSKKNSTLPEIFKDIQRQTSYSFVYNTEMMQGVKKINIEVKNASLETVLGICFKETTLTYNLVDQTVIVRKKEPIASTVKDTVRDIGAKFIDVRGKVIDEQKKPVQGATVALRGSTRSTMTDVNGNFFLETVPANGVLGFSFVGYQPREIRIAGSQNILTQLNITAGSLDETIVVAYRTTTNRANTGAVSVVKGTQIASMPNTSFDKSLQGLVPGLLVTSGNGQPGGAPSQFLLRGIATGGNPALGQTFRNPLIIIDGVPITQDPTVTDNKLSAYNVPVNNPMAQLNPSDIESISVLKDASAISLYGSKASNGVILVTTKKGGAGKNTYTFQHQTDFSQRLDGKIELLNQDQYLELLYETYRNSLPGITDKAIKSDLLSKFPYIVYASGDTSFYPQQDWSKELFRPTAITSGNDFSISGGTERSSFYLNIEHYKQNGIAKGTDYDRQSLRFNYENRLATWANIGLNTAISYNVQNFNIDNESYLTISPLLPIRNIDGEFLYNYSTGATINSSTFRSNPLAATELNINRNHAYRGLTTVRLEINPLKNFTLSSTLGVNFISNELTEKTHPSFILPEDQTPGKGRVESQNFRSTNIITTNSLTYSRDILNNHSISFILGQEAQIATTKNLSVRVTDIASNPLQDQPIGGVSSSGLGSNNKNTLLSYFGQFNYNLKSKYYVSSSIRADGSSLFGNNERFGAYWSVGLGWILSDESFMKFAKGIMQYAKLRGSFGSAGNSSAIQKMSSIDRIYIMKYLGNPVVSVPLSTTGNPGIKWEQTYTWDAGIEFSLFKKKLNLTIDLYNRKTSDLIADDINIASATGFTFYTDNIGDLKNSGVELSASLNLIQNRHFHWNVSFNWSRNQNKLVKSFYPKLTVYGSTGILVNEVGQEFNSFYLPIWAGVNPSTGRPQWIDSTTGKPSEILSNAKREIVGKSQPDGFGSFSSSINWRGFDFSCSIYYQYGNKIFYYGGNSLQNDGTNPYYNQNIGALKRWRVNGDIASNPRRLLDGSMVTDNGIISDQGTFPSTRYLLKGDFIRLSNLAFAYTFSSKITEEIHLNNLRIFIQGHNLITITKYSGQDPENSTALGAGTFMYPQARSFSFGIQTNF